MLERDPPQAPSSGFYRHSIRLLGYRNPEPKLGHQPASVFDMVTGYN